MIHSENLNKPQPAIVGTEYENPTILSRNDAEGQEGIWKKESVYGFWNVEIAKS